jgi:hypothetical protein
MLARCLPFVVVAIFTACRDPQDIDPGLGMRALPSRIGVISIADHPEYPDRSGDPPTHRGNASAVFVDTIAEPGCAGREIKACVRYFCPVGSASPRAHAGTISLSAPVPVGTVQLEPDARGVYPQRPIFTLPGLAEGNTLTISAAGGADATVPPFTITARVPGGQVSVQTPEKVLSDEYRLSWEATGVAQVRALPASSAGQSESVDYCLLPGGIGQLNTRTLFTALAPVEVASAVVGDWTIVVLLSRTLTLVPPLAKP